MKGVPDGCLDPLAHPEKTAHINEHILAHVSLCITFFHNTFKKNCGEA